RSLSAEWTHRSSSSWVPLATLPSGDSYPGDGWKSAGASPPRSASRVGPSRMHTLIGVVTPTSAPAARAALMASLITPRSAPSVRLMCVYHWYFSRLVRMACSGLAMQDHCSYTGGGSARHGSARDGVAGSCDTAVRGSSAV